MNNSNYVYADSILESLLGERVKAGKLPQEDAARLFNTRSVWFEQIDFTGNQSTESIKQNLINYMESTMNGTYNYGNQQGAYPQYQNTQQQFQQPGFQPQPQYQQPVYQQPQQMYQQPQYQQPMYQQQMQPQFQQPVYQGGYQTAPVVNNGGQPGSAYNPLGAGSGTQPQQPAQPTYQAPTQQPQQQVAPQQQTQSEPEKPINTPPQSHGELKFKGLPNAVGKDYRTSDGTKVPYVEFEGMVGYDIESQIERVEDNKGIAVITASDIHHVDRGQDFVKEHLHKASTKLAAAKALDCSLDQMIKKMEDAIEDLPGSIRKLYDECIVDLFNKWFRSGIITTQTYWFNKKLLTAESINDIKCIGSIDYARVVYGDAADRMITPLHDSPDFEKRMARIISAIMEALSAPELITDHDKVLHHLGTKVLPIGKTVLKAYTDAGNNEERDKVIGNILNKHSVVTFGKSVQVTVLNADGYIVSDDPKDAAYEFMASPHMYIINAELPGDKPITIDVHSNGKVYKFVTAKSADGKRCCSSIE